MALLKFFAAIAPAGLMALWLVGGQHVSIHIKPAPLLLDKARLLMHLSHLGAIIDGHKLHNSFFCEVKRRPFHSGCSAMIVFGNDGRDLIAPK